MLLLDVTKEDEEALQEVVKTAGCKMPNVKLSVYKNRRGSYNRCYLWMNADKGTCRFKSMFATTFNYDLIAIKDTNIEVGI